MSETQAAVAPKRKRQAVRAPAILGHRFGEKEFQILLNCLSEGMTITAAAKRTGFSRTALYEWMGRNPNKLVELKKHLEPVLLMDIHEIGKENRQAIPLCWMLERSFPERYALTSTTRIEVSGQVDHHVHMITESELARMAQLTRDIEAEVL